MTAAPASHGHWLPSSKQNPCPICWRTKDGDCRISADGQEAICHHPKDLRPGLDVVNGWAFTGNTSDGRAGHFTIDKPRERSKAPRAVPLERKARGQAAGPRPKPAPISRPIELASLPEPAKEPPARLPSGTRLEYGTKPEQWVKVEVDGSGKKSHKPWHRDSNGKAIKKAGLDPWPLWCEGEAIEHGPGRWITEAEGEKCARWLQAGGLVAVSQPGHDHKPHSIERRYRRLLAAGVLGVLYLADNDPTGVDKAERCAAAADAVGLQRLIVHAADVWPGLPRGGSIDDAPGTASDRVTALESAIATALELQSEQQATQKAPPETCLADLTVCNQLDALLGPEQEGRLRKPPKDLLTQVVEAVVPLRFNQLTNRIENDGQPVDGDFLGTLYLQLAERYAIDVQKERAADAALLVSRRRAFHPVRLYLQDLESRSIRLPAEDWAALDARVFGSEVSGGWGIVHLQRQLIAAVARAMQPGCEVHTALVLHSDQQGIGKSSLWKILGGAWFSDSLGDLKDLKEDRLQLHSAWIHEWGEIDAVMGKRDSETLKRFLSCSQDDVRRPYGRGTEQLKRSCVIVGTTNRRDFIKDPTGNRRFPIISIQQVNTPWIKEHRDAIWGSALAAYKAGERWHYNDQEIAHINDAALAFAAEDPLRDQIETWAEDHPDVQEAPLARILPEAGCTPSGEPPDQKLVQRASSVMRSLGWRRADKKRRYLLPNGDRTDNTWGWLRDAA